MGLMTNFLSLKEMFRISLQGKPIFGVILNKQKTKQVLKKTFCIVCHNGECYSLSIVLEILNCTKKTNK